MFHHTDLTDAFGVYIKRRNSDRLNRLQSSMKREGSARSCSYDFLNIRYATDRL